MHRIGAPNKSFSPPYNTWGTILKVINFRPKYCYHDSLDLVSKLSKAIIIFFEKSKGFFFLSYIIKNFTFYIFLSTPTNFNFYHMCLLTKCLSDNIVYFISFYPLPLSFYYMCLTKYKYQYDNRLNNMIFGGIF